MIIGATGSSAARKPEEVEQRGGFLEQEETEETEIFFFRSLFSLRTPVQNSCADNREKGDQPRMARMARIGKG
jgi:hypothetical protein